MGKYAHVDERLSIDIPVSLLILTLPVMEMRELSFISHDFVKAVYVCIFSNSCFSELDDNFN